MIKVSVIVPIYNVEKYISKCIESLINQSLTDIEIILVNDGSTDNSGKIAEEYANKYPDKIRYYAKENGGLSDARNYGIRYAKGKYIAFVDSDDYIDKDLYLNLEKYMNEDYDMIKFKVIKVDEQENELEEMYNPHFTGKNGEEAFEILYKEDTYTEVAWAYLYKNDFWKSNEFKFMKDIYHEDFGLIPLVILKANKVASTDVKAYYYVQSNGSITRNTDVKKTLKKSNDLLICYDNMINQISKYDINKVSQENIKIYYTNAILLEINNIQEKAERKKYIKEIKKRKMVKNIKPRSLKQILKILVLNINIELYLKLR